MSGLFSDDAIWDYIVRSGDTVKRPEPAGGSACPSLARFWAGMRNDWDGWTKEKRAHVSSCAMCQNTMSLAWRLKCPSIWILIQYLAGSEEFEDAQAVQLHLRERDCCRQCELTLRSGFVRAAAKMLSAIARLNETAEEIKAQTDHIKALAQQAAFIYFRAQSRSALTAASEPPAVFTSGESSETVGLTLIETAGQFTFRAMAMPESTVEQAEIVAAESQNPLQLSWEDDRGLRKAQRQIAKDLIPSGEDCLLLIAPALPGKEIGG